MECNIPDGGGGEEGLDHLPAVLSFLVSVLPAGKLSEGRELGKSQGD